jgi:hypothetical protein
MEENSLQALVGWVERSDTHQAIEKIDGYRCAQPILLLFVMNYENIKR